MASEMATDESESISRDVVMLGRYADKRPRDLHVREDGFMRLDDLMTHWFSAKGYSKEKVLNAIYTHMLHEPSDHEAARALRYGIYYDDIEPRHCTTRTPSSNSNYTVTSLFSFAREL